MRRRDELFRARLAMHALGPARPGNRQLRERSALWLDVPAAAPEVAFPRRVRPTDRSHVHPPLCPRAETEHAPALDADVRAGRDEVERQQAEDGAVPGRPLDAQALERPESAECCEKDSDHELQ